MNNPKPTTMTLNVRLVDGSIRRFQFPAENEGDLNLATRIERALEAHDLVIELGDRLLVFPQHSILTIELTPAPAKLPATAIRHGRLVGE